VVEAPETELVKSVNITCLKEITIPPSPLEDVLLLSGFLWFTGAVTSYTAAGKDDFRSSLQILEIDTFGR